MRKTKTVQARVTEPMKETVERVTQATGKTESDFLNYCMVFTLANDTTFSGFCNTKNNSCATGPVCQPVI